MLNTESYPSVSDCVYITAGSISGAALCKIVEWLELNVHVS